MTAATGGIPEADGRRRAAVLCALGRALPPGVVDNAELVDRLDLSEDWIRRRTGISERRVAAAGVTTEDLAVEAAVEALAGAGDAPIDAVVLATTTPDQLCPTMSPGVAARIGLNGIPALDIAAGCGGFLYGLATGAGFIAAGTADRVLVVAAERTSALPDSGDPAMAPLFGDGAGAVVLRRGSATEPGAIGPVILGSDGAEGRMIEATGLGTLTMDGQRVFRHAVQRMSDVSRAAAKAAGWELEDVDRIVPHQANARITAFMGHRLGIPVERQVGNIARVGNTGAASIPVALAEADREGRITPGHRVLLTAFGSGLCWGATTLVWPALGSAA